MCDLSCMGGGYLQVGFGGPVRVNSLVTLHLSLIIYVLQPTSSQSINRCQFTFPPLAPTQPASARALRK